MAGLQLSTRNKLLVLTAVMASLLEIIDTSIVNVAIPTMMGNLGATLDEISWVITGYIIANAIVLPIAGWMGQQIGRKTYYTGCIVLFTAASVACGLAPNLSTLTLFRVIQGFAGGALLPTSQALIYEAFPKEMAGMASAIYGMSVMIGPTLGPTLGGYLTDNFGWRSIFNVNLPLGVAVAILSFLYVEDVGFDHAKHKDQVAQAKAEGAPPAAKARRQRTPIDGIGLALLITGIGCIQYVLERGHADDWFDSKAILICTILGSVSLVGLIWWELRTPHPILELHHFKNVTFRSGVLLMTGLGAMLYGLIFLLPVFVTTIQGLTATGTGELFIPGALASAAMMPIIGNQLRKQRDPRWFVLIGVAGLAAGIWMISEFDSQTSTAGMFWPLLIRGAAMAYLFVPINATVLVQFTGPAIGQAAGMLNLCRQLGGSLCIALLSTLFQQYQDINYVNLGSHVTWFDPAARDMFRSIMVAMHGKMAHAVGMGTYAQDAAKLLYFRVKREAFVLSFRKVLKIAVLGFVLVLFPLRTLRPLKNMPKGPLPDAH